MKAEGRAAVLDPALKSLLWLAPALAPLVMLPLLLVESRLRAAVSFAALPALLVALLAPTGTIDLPWLLLGARFGLDDTGRLFLIFTASLWLAAGIHGWSYLHTDPRRATFFGFFNAAMAGNLGVILAQDAASFYVFFALMSFASYGLVVHNRSCDALHAGRVYIALVIAGELALFAAIVLWAHFSGSIYFSDWASSSAAAPAPVRNWAIALTLIAFGIKVGAVPLHVWLPLAHPAAPTPASAVLSGAMIEAGLFGWLRFLPLGSAAPGWGNALIVLGLAAAFGGALIGALQLNPKSALAYSSISQMGFITVLIGVALEAPDAAPMVTLVVALYAFHHAFAKALLFIGVSMVGAISKGGRAAVAAGMLLPALALAGAPLTSGALAKAELKIAVATTGGNWLAFPLSLAAVGTTLVMLRTLYLARHAAHAHAPNAGMWGGWWLLVGGCAAAIWCLPQAGGSFLVSLGEWTNTLWPILLGVGLAIIGWRAHWSIERISIPPGDLLVPLLRAWPQARFVSADRGRIHITELVSRLSALWTALSQAEVLMARRAGLAIMLMAAAIAALAMS